MKFTLITAGCLASLAALAQPGKSAKAVNIGDPMPDITLTDTRDGGKKTFLLSQLKGKYILLDFWATNCGACLQALPKMGRLQRQFRDQLQIILVNAQTQKGIDSLFKRFPNNALLFEKAGLPSVTGDKWLHQLFPHQLIPHEVWIDEQGKVIAITDDDEVTAANIQRVLKHPGFTLPRKKEFFEYQYREPLLPQVYDPSTQVLPFYSALTRYVPGMAGATLLMVIDSARGTIRITRPGYTILDLYGDAVSQFRYGNPCLIPAFDYGKRVVLEVADSNRYFYNPVQGISRKEWDAENKYGYELILPRSEQDHMYTYMLQDLNRYFQMEGFLSKKRLTCLALVRTSAATPFAWDEKHPPVEYTDKDSVYHLVGMPLSFFRNELSKNNQQTPYAFVDETGYNGNAQLEISTHMGDLPALRKELREKYGLDLVAKEVELEVVVIRETGLRKGKK